MIGLEQFRDGWPTGNFFPGAQKRLVLVCEDSLCPRKQPDVSGPGLGEAGCYSSARRGLVKTGRPFQILHLQVFIHCPSSTDARSHLYLNSNLSSVFSCNSLHHWSFSSNQIAPFWDVDHTVVEMNFIAFQMPKLLLRVAFRYRVQNNAWLT